MTWSDPRGVGHDAYGRPLTPYADPSATERGASGTAGTTWRERFERGAVDAAAAASRNWRRVG